MKKLALVATVAALVLAATAVRTFAADEPVTITGDAKCAKCVLKEGKECQNAIQVKTGDKSVTYYLAANDASKELNGKLCEGAKKVKATGTVKAVEGKMQLTATKIELAEKQ